MPGKVLIVEGLATNRIALKVKLSSACYDVLQTNMAAEAQNLAEFQKPDLIILSDELPDGSGLELCQRLKRRPQTAHIPVVMLTSKREKALRLAALQAGADDILTKPIDDLVMLARLRSLLRARDASEELRLRESTNKALGFAETPPEFNKRANISLVTPDRRTGMVWKTALEERLAHNISAVVLSDALRGLGESSETPDVFVVTLDPSMPDTGLRLLADIRARSKTRHAGVIVVINDAGRDASVDALDLGANDILQDGFDIDEFALRLTTQVQRKVTADRLRERVRDGLRAAVIDPLTGLFNRRYAMPHLLRIAENAHKKHKNFAVMVADLDHFKRINDRYGHAAGDAVLAEVAERIRETFRGVDLVARIGGEEFLVAMPDVSLAQAKAAASRLCAVVRETPIYIPSQDLAVPVTISIGLAMGTDCDDAPETWVHTLLDRADQALYGAKSLGRNQVTLGRPAA